MKRGSTKHPLASTPCLEAWCSILGAICLLKLTLNVPPQPSEHLFVLNGEDGEERGIFFFFFTEIPASSSRRNMVGGAGGREVGASAWLLCQPQS